MTRTTPPSDFARLKRHLLFERRGHVGSRAVVLTPVLCDEDDSAILLCSSQAPSVGREEGARRFKDYTMRIVGLKSEYSCQFKRQAVEPHPCDCSKLFDPIKYPDVLGKIVVNQETHRTTRANLCGLVTSRKVVCCVDATGLSSSRCSHPVGFVASNGICKTS